MRLKLYINAALIKGVADSNRENEKERKRKTQGETKRNDEKDSGSETQVKPQAKCNRTSAQRPTRGRPPLAIYEKSSATDWLSRTKRNVDRHTSKSGHPDPRRLKQTALPRIVNRGARRRREKENARGTKRTMRQRNRSYSENDRRVLCKVIKRPSETAECKNHDARKIRCNNTATCRQTTCSKR